MELVKAMVSELLVNLKRTVTLHFQTLPWEILIRTYYSPHDFAILADRSVAQSPDDSVTDYCLPGLVSV